MDHVQVRGLGFSTSLPWLLLSTAGGIDQLVLVLLVRWDQVDGIYICTTLTFRGLGEMAGGGFALVVLLPVVGSAVWLRDMA